MLSCLLLLKEDGTSKKAYLFEFGLAILKKKKEKKQQRFIKIAQ
jgi:hypothetical protein